MAFTESKIQQAAKAAEAQAQAQVGQPQLADRAEAFGFSITSDEIMVLILVVVAVLAIVSAVLAHRNRRNDLNLMHLVLGPDGHLAPERVIVMTAFSLHTWAVLKWTLSGAVTSADFVSYAGIWVTPLLLQAFMASRARTPAPAVAPAPRGEV